MTDQELLQQYTERANAERESGSTVEISEMPYVAVTLSCGQEYFFQSDEADDLLNEVPEWINAEDYILATAQNW